MKDMKDKFLSIFLAFVRNTFCKERLNKLISDLLDIWYENYVFIDDTHEGGESDV